MLNFAQLETGKKGKLDFVKMAQGFESVPNTPKPEPKKPFFAQAADRLNSIASSGGFKKVEKINDKFLGTVGAVLSLPFEAVSAIEKLIGAGTTSLLQKGFGGNKTFGQLYNEAPTAGGMIAGSLQDLTKAARGKQGKEMSTVDFFMPELIGQISDAGVGMAVLAPIGAKIATKYKNVKVTPEQMVDVVTGRVAQGKPVSPEVQAIIKKEIMKPENSKAIIKNAVKNGVQIEVKQPASPIRQIAGEFVGGKAEESTKVKVGGKPLNFVEELNKVASKPLEIAESVKNDSIGGDMSNNKDFQLSEQANKANAVSKFDLTRYKSVEEFEKAAKEGLIEIPIDKIRTSEPSDAFKTVTKPGRKITEPVEVIMNTHPESIKELGEFVLLDGHHRLQQARINGDKTIKATLDITNDWFDADGNQVFSKTPGSLSELWNQAKKKLTTSWSELQKGNPDLFNTGILRKSLAPRGATEMIPEDVHTLQGKWQNYGQYDEIPAGKIYEVKDHYGYYLDKDGNSISDIRSGSPLKRTDEWNSDISGYEDTTISNQQLKNELIKSFSTKEGKDYLNKVIDALPKNSDGSITAYRIGKISEDGQPQSYTLSEGMAKTFSNQGTDILPAGTPGLPKEGYKDFGALPTNIVKIDPKGIVAWNPYDAEILVESKYVKTKSQLEKSEQKTIKVPREQLPVGKGETKASGLESRVTKTLQEADPDVVDRIGLSTYEQMNKKENIQKATKFVEKNPEEALAILRGEKEAPKGILRNSIYVAMQNLGKGDVALARKLASLTSTRYGQEISILSEIDPNSPVKLMSDIVKLREQAITKKGKTIAKEKKSMVDEIKKEIKKSAPKKQDWAEFIESIKCK